MTDVAESTIYNLQGVDHLSCFEIPRYSALEYVCFCCFQVIALEKRVRTMLEKLWVNIPPARQPGSQVAGLATLQAICFIRLRNAQNSTESDKPDRLVLILKVRTWHNFPRTFFFELCGYVMCSSLSYLMIFDAILVCIVKFMQRFISNYLSAFRHSGCLFS